ncbi:cysteine--tRNA ligase [Desulfofundulus thermobenzoicus]|uniref:Cysteine--tRNA ligase n=1 Tax=Desulfofundulus thermobenzoicus TaxID=29376 RepID=A0A6N7IR01_9FIRM|nr:cysteine--tRNA ligase [Desulfofundulus thermobenzoicus]
MVIYNTLTKKKELFVPRQAGRVDMYVCGPTTYNFIHLGNARPLVFFDTVRRYFQYRGYRVKYIQNFTDVDDKIINRAREEGVDALALSRKYINEYFKDADALNVRRADVHPQVTGHIPEIIDLIAALMEKGAAYEVDGDVYFAISAFPEYGKLSGRTLEEMQAGARVEVDPRKKHPMDFALWKAARAGEPSWDSPWGKGRPGWHIECSAMALKYLGYSFDIHGGGFDLVFPHHENEIAQAEAATGRPFVRYWMHNGFITVNQEKMSKSLGNFFLVREILNKFPPEVVRFFLLSTHYRSPLDFDDEKMAAAGRGLERIRNSIRLLHEALDRPVRNGLKEEDDQFLAAMAKYEREFGAAMDDDFNTALAIGILFELAREVNAYLHDREGLPAGKALERAMDLFRSFNQVLGILRVDETTGRFLQEEKAGGGDDLAGALMDLLLAVRQQARAKKDWATADRIRDGLKELGILLEDTPSGVRWKKLS